MSKTCQIILVFDKVSWVTFFVKNKIWSVLIEVHYKLMVIQVDLTEFEDYALIKTNKIFFCLTRYISPLKTVSIHTAQHLHLKLCWGNLLEESLY